MKKQLTAILFSIFIFGLSAGSYAQETRKIYLEINDKRYIKPEDNDKKNDVVAVTKEDLINRINESVIEGGYAIIDKSQYVPASDHIKLMIEIEYLNFYESQSGNLFGKAILEFEITDPLNEEEPTWHLKASADIPFPKNSLKDFFNDKKVAEVDQMKDVVFIKVREVFRSKTDNYFQKALYLKPKQVATTSVVMAGAAAAEPKKAKPSSDVDVNIPKAEFINNYRFAVIVGNEDYGSYQTDLTSEINVDYAENDATIFKEYAVRTLGIPESNVSLLINATSGQMRQSLAKINKLAEKTDGKAELYFYYAGHGLPDEKTKEAYLIPVDVAGTNVQYGIKLTDIYKSLTEYPTERVTVILDACFSGGARNQGLVSARGVRVAAKEESLSGNLIVFSASSGDQSSLPYKDKGHGIFTYHLLKKLQETKGECTYKELADYVNQTVSLQSVVINSKEQDPQTNVSPAAVDDWDNWKVGKQE